MTVAFNWVIENCIHDIDTGFITTADWRAFGVDGDISVTSYGSVGFSPDGSSGTFIPYDEVTEAEVLSWVWGTVNKDATEAALALQIDLIKNPVTASGTPWQA